MALSARLVMRQGQSLVMTPQLLQAIKLLQLSSIELAAYVEAELERNPVLERAEDRDERPTVGTGDHSEAGPREADWASERLADAGESGSGDAFEPDSGAPAPAAPEFPALSDQAWSGIGASAPGAGGEAPDLEAYVAERPSLRDHLAMQLAVALVDPVDRAIGAMLIDLVDENGYFSGDVGEVAARLGAPRERVLSVLGTIQTFEPSGVGARDLAECLAIQLRERDRFDPAMRTLVANLPLLARREHGELKRLCGVDDEDLADMAAELRRLDPKPGRAFGGGPIEAVVPDVLVRAAPDGSWRVELNADALPKVLVNQSFAARVNAARGSEADRSFVSNCLQTANWLTKSLDQRARTILKVASEIVRQQDAFLAHGVAHLKPLNLKTIAAAIGMHESTVSRVTSSKYMATPRGLFEMKFFFTAAIGSSVGGTTHSAEAVRFRIRQLIDGERPSEILSDDAIVARLREANVDIARRTVAKYRESLRIPSSVERRREKAAGVPRAPARSI